MGVVGPGVVLFSPRPLETSEGVVVATSALHRELSVPVRTPVSFELLHELVNRGIREQADLDFKRTLYHPKNEKHKKELVKDVCAMANSGGGWIICGIADEGDAATEVIGVSLEATTETGVHQMLERRIDPPLTVDIRVYQGQVQSKTKTLVAIRIPVSPDRPHLMRSNDAKDERTFQIPVRKGASTVWLDERALRAMYRKSFNLRDESEVKYAQRLDDLSGKAAEQFPGVALALVLTPHEPLKGKFEKEKLRQFLHVAELNRFAISQGFSFMMGIEQSLRIGDRKYIGTQETNRMHSFIEVDFDGTIAIAIQLGVDDPMLRGKGCLLYTDQPDETTQNEVEYALIQAFNCASHLARSLNPSSDSQLQACLISHQNDPIIIRRNEGSWAGSLLRPRDESVPIKNFRTVSHSLQASPSMEEEHEALTDMLLEVLNQGGIETIRILQPGPHVHGP